MFNNDLILCFIINYNLMAGWQFCAIGNLLHLEKGLKNKLKLRFKFG